jgi:hypothetical protein
MAWQHGFELRQCRRCPIVIAHQTPPIARPGLNFAESPSQRFKPLSSFTFELRQDVEPGHFDLKPSTHIRWGIELAKQVLASIHPTPRLATHSCQNPFSA